MYEKVKQLIEDVVALNESRPPRSNFESCAFCYNELEKTKNRMDKLESSVRCAWKATTAGAKHNVIEVRFQAIYKASIELAIKAIGVAVMAQKILNALKKG